MAKKADFSQIDTGARSVAGGKAARSAIRGASRQGEQPPLTDEERAERTAKMRTQGRKGLKATRINMAFTPENSEFIRIMAQSSGKTMTKICNMVIAAYRREHPELAGEAREFLKKLKANSLFDFEEE